MNGRFLSIKKSTWLIISLVLNGTLFCAFSTVLVFTKKNPDGLFFLFLLFSGAHQLVRSALFGYDSSCFLGVLLVMVGLSYFYSIYFEIHWLFDVFIIFSCSFSCFSVGVLFHQYFQTFVAFSLFFVGIFLLLFKLGILSTLIFVAIILLDVLILIIRFITL